MHKISPKLDEAKQMQKPKTKVKPDDLPVDFGKMSVDNSPFMSPPVDKTEEVIEKDYHEGYWKPKPVDRQMPDGVPHWEAQSVFEDRMSSAPGCVYREVTIRETTNNKEWMHRNMDLTDIGKRITYQTQCMGMFAVGVVAMGGLIWILA